MKTKQTCRHLLIALISSIVFAVQSPVAGCTRALYVAKDGTVLTGRSMDWGEDMHSNVAEAVADLRKEEFRVQTIVLPTGRPANMHLAISDASGDSAIFEYVNGRLVIHHGKDFKVLTNSPTYDQQLVIMEYWKLAGELTKSLPGTSNAAATDKFVEAKLFNFASLDTKFEEPKK